VDVVSEDDFINLKSDEVYILPEFSAEKAEPRVSLVFSLGVLV
jgi:hypothetical protein